MILRIVIPLLNVADLGNVSDSDNCPLIIVGKRRPLCVDEDQAVSGLECVKKRIEQGFLVFGTLYPWSVFQPSRFVGSYSGSASIPYRLAMDLLSILPFAHSFPQARSLSNQPYGVAAAEKGGCLNGVSEIWLWCSLVSE